MKSSEEKNSRIAMPGGAWVLLGSLVDCGPQNFREVVFLAGRGRFNIFQSYLRIYPDFVTDSFHPYHIIYVVAIMVLAA